jgi:tetratricopeptide (TPR) repeat protein
VIDGLAAAAGGAEAARAPLHRVLASGAPADRTGAALLLHGVEPPPAGRAEALAAGIGDKDDEIRSACLRQLRSLGKAAAPAGPALARAVSGGDGRSAASAAALLRDSPEVAAAAIPELVAALSSDDGRVRGSAFALLAGLGTRPAAVVREKLSEGEILRRPEAALLLVSADPDLAGRDPRFLAVLTAALRSRDADVRREGIRLLRACGPRASGAVPALVELLQSPSFGDRAEASRILVDLGAAAVPGLVPVLASPDPDAVMTACRTLGSIRRPAAAAAPALLGAITSKVPWVRRAAAEALVQVAPDDPATNAAMTLLLKDEAPDNRACAARNLGMLRREGSAEALADAAAADRWARMDCSLALGKLGGAGLSRLLRLAEHDDGDVRMWAIRGISSMGPAAREAIPLLRKALNDPASPVRDAADRALRGLDPGKGGPEDPALLLGRKVRDLLDRAGVLAARDKPAEALALYEEATRADPGCTAAWMEVGLVHHHAKRFERALEAYATVLRIDPDHGDALYDSGLCMNSLRRYEDALRYQREAVRVRPGHADALVSMGYTLYQLGRYEESIAAGRDGLRLKPKDTDALQRIGLALLKLDRTAEAVEPLRELVRLAPRYQPGHAFLAAALRRSGDPAAAEPVARKAIEMDPKDLLPRGTLFKSLRTLGRMEEAARELEALRALSPQEAEKAEKGN